MLNNLQSYSPYFEQQNEILLNQANLSSQAVVIYSGKKWVNITPVLYWVWSQVQKIIVFFQQLQLTIYFQSQSLFSTCFNDQEDEEKSIPTKKLIEIPELNEILKDSLAVCRANPSNPYSPPRFEAISGVVRNQSFNWTLACVKADGNCFYYSMETWLKLLHAVDSELPTWTAQELRQKTIEYLSEIFTQIKAKNSEDSLSENERFLKDGLSCTIDAYNEGIDLESSLFEQTKTTLQQDLDQLKSLKNRESLHLQSNAEKNTSTEQHEDQLILENLNSKVQETEADKQIKILENQIQNTEIEVQKREEKKIAHEDFETYFRYASTPGFFAGQGEIFAIQKLLEPYGIPVEIVNDYDSSIQLSDNPKTAVLSHINANHFDLILRLDLLLPLLKKDF